MYPLLILFFGALVGITFMIGRKILMIQNGEIFVHSEQPDFSEISYAENWTVLLSKNLQALGHLALVETIRLYVRATNFLKQTYQEIKRKGGMQNIESEKKEISKFLKIISQYKTKIRKIKERVRKEENSF